MPPVIVVAEAVRDAPNVPLAPEPGAVNVTTTPLMPLPKLSFTVALKAAAKAVPTVELCGVPAVAAMLTAGPALLVSVKLAGVATPVTVAVTAYAPATVLAVNVGAVAIPVASVVTTAAALNVPLAPVP